MSTLPPHTEFAEELILKEILDLAERGVPIEEAIAKYRDLSLETLSTLTLAAYLTRERERIVPPKELLQATLAALGEPATGTGIASWFRIFWRPLAIAVPALAVLALALLGRPATAPLPPAPSLAPSVSAPSATFDTSMPLSAEQAAPSAKSAVSLDSKSPLAEYDTLSVEETSWAFPALEEESSHAETAMREESLRAGEFPAFIYEATP